MNHVIDNLVDLRQCRVWQICGDMQVRYLGLHTWRGGWEEVGHVGRYGRVEEMVEEGDGDYEVELVETFFARLDMR